MASQQQERPITYGDVFGTHADVGQQPVTREDASLMQALETMALGSIPKGGVAAAMQSAADQNVNAGLVPPDAHTMVAEQGMRIEQASAPGLFMQTEYVGGQPVAAAIAEAVQVQYPAGMANNLPDVYQRAIPIDAAAGVLDKPVTIGEALEAAAVGAGDSPIEDSDARAIQSAETLAAGQPLGRGSIGAAAQSAVATNEQFGIPNVHITLGDVLADASTRLPADKVVTEEDAAKVTETELRGRPGADLKQGGVAECMQAAADVNVVIAPGAAAMDVLVPDVNTGNDRSGQDRNEDPGAAVGGVVVADVDISGDCGTGQTQV